MRLGAISPVFNEEKLIRGCIESFRPFVDEHIILSASKSLYGNQANTDRTNEIASSLGAIVVEGVWEEEHVQRNHGIKILQYCDWILVNDADMWFEHKEVEKLIKVLERVPKEVNALVTPQLGYWKDIDHILDGDDFKPVVAIRPNVRFWTIGCVDCDFWIAPIMCHHLVWCEPKDIYKKVTTYSHSPEFDGHKWYHEHYLTWKEGQPAVLPTGSLPVKYSPLPQELRRYLDAVL